MKLKLAMLAAASALALNAHAVTVTNTNWDEHATVEQALGIERSGLFEDSYLFHLSNAMNLFNTTVSNNNGDERNLINGHVFLFREAGPTDTPIGDFAFDGSTGTAAHSFGALAGGDYYYRVTGNANGLSNDDDETGGSYSLTSRVKAITTAVPEPQTYALMLAGLGVVGFLARRRRPQA